MYLVLIFFLFCFLSPSWHSPSFLQLYFGVFHHFWKILNHYIFKHFFCLILSLFFWDSNYTRMRPHDFVSHLLCTVLLLGPPSPFFNLLSFNVYNLYLSVIIFILFFLGLCHIWCICRHSCILLSCFFILQFPLDSFLQLLYLLTFLVCSFMFLVFSTVGYY